MLTLTLQPPHGAQLLKDGRPIGRATLRPGENETFSLEEFHIQPPFRRKGYGTWFLRKLLRACGVAPAATVYAPAAPDDEAAAAFLRKFGFSPLQNGMWCRQALPQVNALSIAHAFLQAHVQPGGFAIDATAGNGHDTALLCRLVGPTGRVLALDVQPAAVQATNARLARLGFAQGRAVCANHARLAAFAAPGTVDAIVFNLGYLPGGDHALFTTPAHSLPALDAALTLLRPGGVLTVCAYSGGAQGTTERDAVLAWAQALPPASYTVQSETFPGRTGHPPIVFCIRRSPLSAQSGAALFPTEVL